LSPDLAIFRVPRATSRVALVTGANRGIGLEVCRQLLEAGLRVAMTGRNLQALQDGAARLNAPDMAMAVRLDVTNARSIADAHDTIARRFGAVDVLVNNAAILLHENTDVLSIPAEAYLRSLESNVLGVIETCRVFVPGMASRRYGRIVNVSSGAGQLSRMSTYAPAYSMSKTALNAFTAILAASYQDSGILANAVDPGWVRTDMGGPSAPRTVEQGADTIVWLATLPDNGPTGGFFRDRKPIPW